MRVTREEPWTSEREHGSVFLVELCPLAVRGSGLSAQGTRRARCALWSLSCPIPASQPCGAEPERGLAPHVHRGPLSLSVHRAQGPAAGVQTARPGAPQYKVCAGISPKGSSRTSPLRGGVSPQSSYETQVELVALLVCEPRRASSPSSHQRTEVCDRVPSAATPGPLPPTPTRMSEKDDNPQPLLFKAEAWLSPDVL